MLREYKCDIVLDLQYIEVFERKFYSFLLVNKELLVSLVFLVTVNDFKSAVKLASECFAGAI